MAKDLTYNPLIFDAPDMEAARRIILTREAGRDTDERWTIETPYLAQLIGDRLQLGPGKLVIDYGCGIGRLSKALIGMFGCAVLGVDISAKMRALAPEYVDAASFSVVSRRVLQLMAERGLRADAAISVWVLQHCLNPAEDIGLIRSALSPQGQFFVANNQRRAVPAVEVRWGDDGQDVAALLAQAMTPEQFGRLDPAAVGQAVSDATFWGLYRA